MANSWDEEVYALHEGASILSRVVHSWDAAACALDEEVGSLLKEAHSWDEVYVLHEGEGTLLMAACIQNEVKDGAVVDSPYWEPCSRYEVNAPHAGVQACSLDVAAHSLCLAASSLASAWPDDVPQHTPQDSACSWACPRGVGNPCWVAGTCPRAGRGWANGSASSPL